jgi:hypothetical protein
MLAIFDQQKGSLAAARLVADALLSLLRQWALRPEFWEEPITQPALDRVPVFRAIEGFMPRAGALIDGALASVVVFTAVCLVMEYTWNHPAHMPIMSMYRSGSPIYWRRPTPQLTPSPSGPQAAAEQPTYIDGGRVVLVIQNPSKSTEPKP